MLLSDQVDQSRHTCDEHRQFRTGCRGIPRYQQDLRIGADLRRSLNKYPHVQSQGRYLQIEQARRRFRRRTLDRSRCHLALR